MLVVFIIAFTTLKKAGIEGNDWVLVTLSLLVALIFVSSTKATSFAIKSLPLLTLITTVIFFVTLITVFLTSKDFDPFKKILAWIGFILAILVILCLAFQQFPTMNHMLPYSSDAGLDSNLREFKDFIYSQNFINNLIFVISIVVVGWFLLSTKAKKK
jgi:FtsH-binding integral membrane protein